MIEHIKKALAILLAVCFLMSITAVAVSAADKGKDFLYIGDRADDTVKQFDANSGNFISNFVSSGSGGLHGPGGILFEKNGNFLVSNQNVNQPSSGNILRYNGKTGVFETALTNSTDINAPFAPRGIILNDFKLYVADIGDTGRRGNVSSYNEHNGAFLGNLAQNAIQDINYHPRGIVFGPDGNLYVSTVEDLPPALGGHVLCFNPDGSLNKVFIADVGGVGKLNRPEGLVFGPDGNLYITSFRAGATDTDSIRIYSPNGEFLKKIDLYNVGESRAYAQAIIFGPNGRLFIPITNTGEVRRYNVNDGTYDSFVKAGGELKSPYFLTFGKTDPKNLGYRN